MQRKNLGPRVHHSARERLYTCLVRLSLVMPALALKVTYPWNTDSTLLKKELLPEAEQKNIRNWFDKGELYQ